MKRKQTVWANCLVKNEERWVWYAINSVINEVDKILVWDTGSTDNTVKIVKSIKSPKIEFKEYGPVTKETYPQARQEMLEATKSDWMFILDGDEIWTKEAINTFVNTIQHSNDLESIVVKTINWIGDVYHFQDESAGKYEIAGHKGHLNLRGINVKIPGLHAAGAHGEQGYFDRENNAIQNRDPNKIAFLPVSYYHATHLPRSSKREKELEVPLRAQKRKYVIGQSLPINTRYPEVFYLPRPKFVPSPWLKMNKKYYLLSLILTPLRKIKRKLIK